MKYLITLSLICCLSTIGYSQQFNDLFKIEQTYSPDSDDFDFNSTEVQFNIPVKLKKSIYK